MAQSAVSYQKKTACFSLEVSTSRRRGSKDEGEATGQLRKIILLDLLVTVGCRFHVLVNLVLIQILYATFERYGVTEKLSVYFGTDDKLQTTIDTQSTWKLFTSTKLRDHVNEHRHRANTIRIPESTLWAQSITGAVGIRDTHTHRKGGLEWETNRAAPHFSIFTSCHQIGLIYHSNFPRSV